MITFKHGCTQRAFAIAWLSVAAVGCNDSNANPSPDDSIINTTAKAGRAASDVAGKAGSASAGKGGDGSKAGGGGKSGGAGGAGGAGKSAVDDDAGMKPGDDGMKPSDDACKGTKDCVCVAPTTQQDFLNHCTEATCNPYDNSKLKRLNSDGSLPAIP